MQATTAFDNMPNDLDFSGETAPVDMAQATQQTFVTTPAFKEPCKKCRGSGTYYGMSRFGSECFACKGKGFFTFKTSPEKRAKRAASAADKREQAAADERQRKQALLSGWRAEHADAAAWIDANDGKFDFATAMSNSLAQWGSLTEGQLAAVLRCIERDAARKAEAQQRAADAPVVDTTELEAAFQRAKDAGLKRVRLTMAGLQVKPAKDSSPNAGALYVIEEGQYLGKVMGGRFLRVRDCTTDQEQQVLKLLADPKGAAQAYGIETGVCCICSRELTDPVSIANGIGPICAGRFGW